MILPLQILCNSNVYIKQLNRLWYPISLPFGCAQNDYSTCSLTLIKLFAILFTPSFINRSWSNEISYDLIYVEWLSLLRYYLIECKFSRKRNILSIKNPYHYYICLVCLYFGMELGYISSKCYLWFFTKWRSFINK